MRIRSQPAPPREHDKIAESEHRPLLGSLLVQAGELDDNDLDRISEYQARTGTLFGEAAIDLGYVTPDAVARATADQDEARLLNAENSPVSRAVVAAFDALDPLTLKLRALRASLFGPEELKRSGSRIIVIAGVTGNDTPGLAANLAVVTAQLGLDTLLVDANFVAPALHNLFAVSNNGGVSSLFVDGRSDEVASVPTPVPCLDLLPSGAAMANVADTVERIPLCATLRSMRQRHRVIVVDAGAQAPETIAAIARGSDGVVVVAERRRTPMQKIGQLIARLEGSDVEVLGTVLAR